MEKKGTVYLGLSGGVDSAVAGARVLQQGYDVVPVFLKWWENVDAAACPWKEDQEAALATAEALGISDAFRTWNFSEEFFQDVFTPLIEDAKAGFTGNPDADCNRVVKFGAFLNRALAEGADFVATGHYSRVRRAGDQYELLRPLCEAKNDQTYFLWQLTQEQLARVLFPIGEFPSKEAVRAEAQKRGLPSADRKSTRGICGIEKRNYASGYSDFLGEYIPGSEGDIVTTGNRVVGRHAGVARYTLGQRKGIGVIADGGPYYVVEKDFHANILRVASSAEAQSLLFKEEAFIRDVKWISGNAPAFPLQCSAFVRHPQIELVSCSVMREGETLRVRFDEPQWSPTPGQSIVLYDGDVVLGGGVIQER